MSMGFFFFKQKTSYEVRISDWSSACALPIFHNLAKARIKGINHRFPGIMGFAFSSNLSMTLSTSVQEFDVLLVGALAGSVANMGHGRSAERRVGKECVSTCRYRWSPSHKNKKKY